MVQNWYKKSAWIFLGQCLRVDQGRWSQSIIGATLNRRDGSERVVCGFEADSRGILVYACPYHFYE